MRLRGDDLYRRIGLLEPSPGAHDGAPGPQPAYQCIHLGTRGEDLCPGGLVVAARIVRGGKLIEEVRAILLRDLACRVRGTLDPEVGVCPLDLSTVDAQHSCDVREDSLRYHQ